MQKKTVFTLLMGLNFSIESTCRTCYAGDVGKIHVDSS